jgi:hypothetical protein
MDMQNEGEEEKKGKMSVEEAGKMGGERERELVQEGHMAEGEEEETQPKSESSEDR